MHRGVQSVNLVSNRRLSRLRVAPSGIHLLLVVLCGAIIFLELLELRCIPFDGLVQFQILWIPTGRQLGDK